MGKGLMILGLQKRDTNPSTQCYSTLLVFKLEEATHGRFQYNYGMKCSVNLDLGYRKSGDTGATLPGVKCQQLCLTEVTVL